MPLNLLAAMALLAQPWAVYQGSGGPGQGKHVVLVSGDEEYRSEEALPQLGKILATRHGFRCTVLFAIDPKDGTVNPERVDNIPGLEALRTADLMVINVRFRALPDEQMRLIDDYVQSGRPILGMRPVLAGFRFPEGSTSPYKHYDYRDKNWDGGFARQVLGETWIAHHGHHGVQSTRGVIAPESRTHPIVRGCEDIWGPTDVYTIRLPLAGDARPLVFGQVLEGMKPSDKPVVGEYVREVKGKKVVSTPNQPLMPIAWTRTYTGKRGKPARVFTTTMGASVDLQSEGFRRLLVNAVYWCVGMEKKIPKRAKVDLVGDYQPTWFGFGKHRHGLKPADF